MDAVLVVAHGSKSQEGKREFLQVISMLRKKLPHKEVEYAFLEGSTQTIPGGIAALAQQGISRVQVLPCFLFSGFHLQKSIPDILEDCRRENPNMEIIQAPPLGPDAKIADILAERAAGGRPDESLAFELQQI